METFAVSVISTICCLGGPVALWVAHRQHPEWFVGRVTMVKWIVAGCIGMMLITLAANLYWLRSHPAAPPAFPAESAADRAKTEKMKEQFFAPPTHKIPNINDGAKF